jgi:hypothetical protein
MSDVYVEAFSILPHYFLSDGSPQGVYYWLWAHCYEVAHDVAVQGCQAAYDLHILMARRVKESLSSRPDDDPLAIEMRRPQPEWKYLLCLLLQAKE